MLRILHTSDWHLGQHFIGKSREACHRAFFQWLTHTIERERIDVLLVAGDIFDTATPPSYARELYHQLLANLHHYQVQTIILGGNHDSVAVLSESASLLRVLNTQVIPGLAAERSSHLVPLRNKAGQPCAVLVALPFLRARDLSSYQGLLSQAGQTEQDKNRDLQQQIAALYQQLYADALQHAQQLSERPLPILGTGHLTTVGASRTESVREIYIGNLEAFRADGFPPFAYLALGHIHQAQQVAGNPYFRYSGAPLALGFDEINSEKQVLLIEIDEQGQVALPVSLPIPTIQPMASVTATLGDVRQQVLSQLSQRMPDWQQQATPTQLWLEIILTGEDALLSDVQLQLQQQLAELPVEVLKLRRARSSAQAVAAVPLSLHELTPNDVLHERLRLEQLSDESEQRLTALHNEVLHQVQTRQHAAQVIAQQVAAEHEL